MFKCFLSIWFVLFLYGFSYSQQNSITVTYKLKTVKSDMDKNQSEHSYSTDVILQNVRNGLEEVEYKLFCNSTISICFLQKKLQLKDDLGYKLASIMGGSGIYFKDTKSRIRINQKQVSEIFFNISYPYKLDEWTITKETKIISGYLCYKATSVRKEYDSIRDRENVFYPEVWFAPNIPFPFGSKGLDGLPGLVLEGSINSIRILYASKIDFKCDDCEKIIQKPENGEDITKDDYFKLLEKIRSERE